MKSFIQWQILVFPFPTTFDNLNQCLHKSVIEIIYHNFKSIFFKSWVTESIYTPTQSFT